MKLGWHWRVGAEQAKSRLQADYVTVVGEDGRLFMSPSEARAMAVRLKKAADFLDPPKRRKT